MTFQTGRRAWRAEALAAGACAVQVGTVVFHDPSAPTRIARGLADALSDKGFDRVADVVGIAHT